VPARKYRGTAHNLTNDARRAPSHNESDLSDKSSHVRALAKDRVSRNVGFQRRIESLRSVDDAVAATVEAVRAAGELERTLFVFTSDNGYLLGEHQLGGKTVGFEESIRVPFLMRGPGVPTGAVSERVVTATDIAPTIVEAAGATSARVLDGRSFLGASGQDRFEPGRATLIQAGYPRRADNSDPKWWYRGLRTGRYTYWRWYDGTEELYDRQRDPFQLRNAADSPGCSRPCGDRPK
jgi:N-acetylglucosamine-6-sulfatase